jgi:hypothetical protein
MNVESKECIAYMAAVMFEADTKLLTTITKSSRDNLATYLVNLCIKAVHVAGFERVNDKFRSRLPNVVEQLENCFVFVSDPLTLNMNNNAASALAKVQCEIMNYLQCARLGNMPYAIRFISCGFNSKRFDELFLGKTRLRMYNHDESSIINKSRLSSWNFSRVNVNELHKIFFKISDMVDWHPGMTLKKATEQFELPKGDAPLKLLGEYFAKRITKLPKKVPPKSEYFSIDDKTHDEIKSKWFGRQYDAIADGAAYCALDAYCVYQLKKKTEQMIHETFYSRLGGVHVDFIRYSGIPAMSYHVLASFLSSMAIENRDYLHAPQGVAYDMIRKAYFGGRVNMFFQGVMEMKTEKWLYGDEKMALVDVTSLYPLSMTAPYPCGRISFMSDHMRRAVNNVFREDFGKQLTVSMVPPFYALTRTRWPKKDKLNDCNLPSYATSPRNVLQARREILTMSGDKHLTAKVPQVTGGRKVWDLCDGITVMDFVTAVLRHNEGWIVELLPYRHNIVFEGKAPLLRFFIKMMAYIKENAAEGSSERTIGKLVMNGTYGYCAMKTDGSRYKTMSAMRAKKLLSDDTQEIWKIILEKPNSSVVVKTKPITWVNSAPYQLGQMTTAYANYVMVTTLMRATDIDRGKLPLFQRKPYCLYTDTDSIYTTEKIAQSFESTFSQNIGCWDDVKKTFNMTCKIEKKGITKICIVAPKMMYTNTDDNECSIKARGHCLKKRNETDQPLTASSLDALFRNDEISNTFTCRSSFVKSVFNSTKKRTAMSVYENQLKRIVREPPVAVQRNPNDKCLLNPYTDNECMHYFKVDLPERYLESLTCNVNDDKRFHYGCGTFGECTVKNKRHYERRSRNNSNGGWSHCKLGGVSNWFYPTAKYGTANGKKRVRKNVNSNDVRSGKTIRLQRQTGRLRVRADNSTKAKCKSYVQRITDGIIEAESSVRMGNTTAGDARKSDKQ